MPVRKVINGEDFGKKLLDPAFKIIDSTSTYKRDREILLKINKIRKNINFKDCWNLLWRWRSISNKQDRIMFFKVQSLLRNKDALIKQQEFANKNDIYGFYNYVDKNYFIPLQYVFLYLNYQLISEFKRSNNDSCDSNPSLVLEILSEEDYTESRYISSFMKNRANFYGRPIDYIASWDYDLSVIESDRIYDEPIIYLRIDLRGTNDEIINGVEDFIDLKRKELQIKKNSYIDWNSMEMALMIHDLNNQKFSDEDIKEIIQRTVDEDCSVQYVKEKLGRAKVLIENSIKRDFPPKS